jgi:uncharacterized protein
MLATQRPDPEPTPETKPFWDAARHSELNIQKCRTCERFFFYPRRTCRHCHSEDVEWRRVSGRGRLSSFTIDYVSGPTPTVIALVELDEGPRMMTNIVGCKAEPDSLPIDAEVRVDFEHRDRYSVPVFRLIEADQ